MDQKYVETVRACKVLLRNLDYLEENVTYHQRAEMSRLMQEVRDRMDVFLAAEEMDPGSWVGEE